MLREKLTALAVAVLTFATVSGGIVGVGIATSDTPATHQAFRRDAEKLAQQDAARPIVVAAGRESGV